MAQTLRSVVDRIIISGDKHLLKLSGFQGISILTLRAFVAGISKVTHNPILSLEFNSKTQFKRLSSIYRQVPPTALANFSQLYYNYLIQNEHLLETC